jgi:hypothetical protein
VRTDEDGILRAELGDFCEQEYVCIDNIWYEMRDEYGYTIARWFVLDVD